MGKETKRIVSFEESKKLEGEDLKEVSGGSRDQFKQIRDFIQTHDPEYEINDQYDIVMWLRRRSGIPFISITYDPIYYNEYVLLDGRTINQEQLMYMLYENYGELP